MDQSVKQTGWWVKVFSIALLMAIFAPLAGYMPVHARIVSIEEDFNNFQVDQSLLAQSPAWVEDVSASRLEAREARVLRAAGADNFVRIRIRGGADSSTGDRPYTSYSLNYDLIQGLGEELEEIAGRGAFKFSVEVNPGWRGAYQGQGMSIRLHGEKGLIASLEYSGSGNFSLNGSATDTAYPGNWHRVTLESDAEQMVRFLLNDEEMATEATLREFALSDLTKVEFLAQVTGRAGQSSMQADINNFDFKLRKIEDFELVDFEHLQITGPGDIYRLIPGQRIFADKSTRWTEITPVLAGSPAFRQEWGTEVPVVIETRVDGLLLAVPWVWDYGFYHHLPLVRERVIDGFKLLQERAIEFEGGYYPLNLYGLDLEKGEHRMALSGYWGQWIVVGFRPGSSVQSQAMPVEIEGGKTRHNIFLPGAEASIRVEPASMPLEIKLFHRGELFKSIMATSLDNNGLFNLTVPPERGRYAAVFKSAKDSGKSKTLPLTVSYPEITEIPALGKDFFPIQFWGGWGYRGQLTLHPRWTGDLQTLAMFELGANTYYTGKGDSELVDALNAKRVISAGREGHMAFYRQEHTPEEAQEQLQRHLLTRWEWPKNVIGWMIVDEPDMSDWRKERIAALEDLSRTQYPDRHLLYCLVGGSRVEHVDNWREMGSSVRRARIYPVRRNRDVDETIRSYADTLAAWQSGDTDSPLWLIMQIFGDRGQTMDIWDAPTPEQVKMMAHLAMARGVKALTYFAYGSDRSGPERLNSIADYPFVPSDGRYQVVEEINRFILRHEERLLNLHWQGSIVCGNQGDRIDLQSLRDSEGNQYLWITNMNWQESFRGIVQPELPASAAAAGSLREIDNKQVLEISSAGSFAIELLPGEGFLFKIIGD